MKGAGRILNGCQKGLKNITSSYGNHEKNIKFIRSGKMYKNGPRRMMIDDDACNQMPRRY